jgi:hypothetical protein
VLATAHNTPLAIALSCSDADFGDTLNYAIVSGPAYGTLGPIDQATGHVTYTPKHGYPGTDSFSYRVADSHGVASSTATAAIAVGANRPPSCGAQTVAIAYGKRRAVTLGCLDPDPADSLRWAVLTRPSHGTLGAVGSTGRITYTPRTGFFGRDRFTFNATDSEGAASGVRTVTLDVAHPTCGRQTGAALARCRATLAWQSALYRCSLIKARKARAACASAANRAYRRAIARARPLVSH